MSNQPRPSSGLTYSDVYDARVFMRTLEDAISCAEDIAAKEAARAHFKN
jgi:hypothetical protein